VKEAHTDLLVRHLTPAEAQRDLRLVALTEKTYEIAELDLVIAFVSARPELHFLDLDLLQLELGLVLLLRLAILEFAVIHDPANRRLGHRGDIDQIALRRLSLRPRA